MAKHPRPRATCATCGKRVAVHADSTLWPHSEGYKPFRPLCPGSEHHPDWRQDERPTAEPQQHFGYNPKT
jgi:hypothetical protein